MSSQGRFATRRSSYDDEPERHWRREHGILFTSNISGKECFETKVANLCPLWAEIRADVGRVCANVGQTRPTLARMLADLGQTCASIGRNLEMFVQVVPHFAFGQVSVRLGVLWPHLAP